MDVAASGRAATANKRLEHLAGRAGGLVPIVGAGRPLPAAGGTQGQLALVLGGLQGHLGLGQRGEAGQRRGSWRRGGDNGWQHGRVGGGLSRHAGLGENRYQKHLAW